MRRYDDFDSDTNQRIKTNMVAQCPELPAKAMYGPTRAAALLGVSRSTLARYCEDGRIVYTVRRNGQRAFTGGALMKFWRHYYLPI